MVAYDAVTIGWRVLWLVAPVMIVMFVVATAAAPDSVTASLTLKRSLMNTAPSPSSSASTTLLDEIARVLSAASERVEAELGKSRIAHADTVGFAGIGTGAGVFSRMNTAARTSASVASGM